MKLIGSRGSRRVDKTRRTKKARRKSAGKLTGMILLLLFIAAAAVFFIWYFTDSTGQGDGSSVLLQQGSETDEPSPRPPTPTSTPSPTPTPTPQPEETPTPTPEPVPETPPVFEGLRNIESMQGVPIIYRLGVSAYDGLGRPLEFDVDSSNVDHNKIGVYTAVFRAEDDFGMSTETEVAVHIIRIDPEWVNERIDEVLIEILTDDMTQVDQAQAIFTWIKSNVSFAAMAAAPQSAYEGAYRALQDRRGGCTIFSSLSYVMLTRAEIPNLRIDRVPEAPTRHRWNLINPDGLGWYHFDAFPILLGGPRNELYMFTASHAANFTRQMTAVDGVAMYYVYDPDLYPEIVYE